MSKYYPFGATTYNLGTSIGSTDTTIILSSFLEPVTGVPYTMTLLNTDIVFATIAPKTTSSEFISFTGITQNANGTATLTGVIRGLAKKYPLTSDAAYKVPHSGQSQFIISDAPQVFQEYVSNVNDQAVDGVKTFSSSPLVPDPTTALQVANKEYVDNIAIAGSPNASTTVKGIGKVSVAPVSPTSPIFVGDNDPRVPTQGENDALVGNNTDIAVGSTNKFVTQTGLQHGAETYTIDTSGSSTAYVATYAPAFTSLTDGMVLRVKLVNANTTTSPTFAPNSLTAHTIVKLGGTALAVGDISANMLCTLVYDLSNTRWVLQNPVNATLYQEYIFTSTGTFTVPRGVTSVLVDIVGAGGGGGGSSNVSGAAGGGGGGQGAFNVSSNVTALTALTVTIGAGGTIGSSAGGNGGNGGTTSFNGISKTGGTGGTGSTGSTGQAGGAAGDSTGGTGGTGGSTSSSGSTGGTGTGGGSGGAGGVNSGTNGGGGGGGASGIGATGGNGGTGTGGNGTAGVYGSGGGGGSNQGTGGLGGAGLVIIKVPLSQII